MKRDEEGMPILSEASITGIVRHSLYCFVPTPNYSRADVQYSCTLVCEMYLKYFLLVYATSCVRNGVHQLMTLDLGEFFSLSFASQQKPRRQDCAPVFQYKKKKPNKQINK